MMNWVRLLGGLVICGIAVSGAAFAGQTKSAGRESGHGSDIVAKRVAHMRSAADDMRTIADMLYGIEPFNGAQVAALSKAVAKRSGAAMVALFEAAEQPENSRAKATIWSDPKGFQKHADELKRLAEQLQVQAEKAAQEGTIARVQAIVARSAYLNIDHKLLAEARAAMQPLQKTFMAMAGQCKSCHQTFRKPKQDDDPSDDEQ